MEYLELPTAPRYEDFRTSYHDFVKGDLICRNLSLSTPWDSKKLYTYVGKQTSNCEEIGCINRNTCTQVHSFLEIVSSDGTHLTESAVNYNYGERFFYVRWDSAFEAGDLIWHWDIPSQGELMPEFNPQLHLIKHVSLTHASNYEKAIIDTQSLHNPDITDRFSCFVYTNPLFIDSRQRKYLPLDEKYYPLYQEKIDELLSGS